MHLCVEAYIYIYIYMCVCVCVSVCVCVCVSSSSRNGSTKSLDSLFLSIFSIVHHSWQVLLPASSVSTELCLSANTGASM